MTKHSINNTPRVIPTSSTVSAQYHNRPKLRIYILHYGGNIPNQVIVQNGDQLPTGLAEILESFNKTDSFVSIADLLRHSM